MPNSRDPETLKIPAYMRKRSIVSQAKQRLILTALDRKEAGVGIHSKQATAPLGSRETNPTLGRGRKLSVTPRSSARSPITRAPAVQRSPVTRAPISRTVETPEISSFSSKKIPSIGTVTHYLEKIDVAIIKLTAPLAVGEAIIMEGDEYLFLQSIDEMQIDRKPVSKAKKGAHIGLKVNHPVVVNGQVYRVPKR